MTDVQVQREVVLDASVAEVWRALTDEAELSAWFGGAVRLDPVPGGRGVFEEEGVVRHAVVEELDDERRLVLRWSAAGEPASRVTFMVDASDAGTVLTVTEVPVAAVSTFAARASSATSWSMRLAGLQLRFALQPVAC